MANKQSEQKYDCISDDIFKEYSVPDFEERAYPKVYYAIREQQGFVSKGLLGDRFNWMDYKSAFEEAFGTLIEPKYDLAQLLEYAQRKFNMNLDDLILANKKSWLRRQAYEQQQNGVVNLNSKKYAPTAMEEIPY